MKRIGFAVFLLVAFSAPALAQGEFCLSVAGGGALYRIAYTPMPVSSGVYQIHGERIVASLAQPSHSIPFSGSAWVLANGNVNISITQGYPWTTTPGSWVHPSSSLFLVFTNAALTGGTYWLNFFGQSASPVISSTGTMAAGQMAQVPCPGPSEPLPLSPVKELNAR